MVAMHEVLKGTTERIVGGNEATPHSHPHQVAMIIDDSFFCGGSLICKIYQKKLSLPLNLIYFLNF